MTQLSRQSIAKLAYRRELITPFLATKTTISGKSAGLSVASYDCRINHDLVVGVNPALIIGNHLLKHGFSRELDLRNDLLANPPYTALAHTIEDFHLPNNVSGQVCDKSTHARCFVSAFNTFFDPGFHGNATLELVNFGDKPAVFKAGDPVCQIIFQYLDVATNKPYDGKYQHQGKVSQGPIYEKESDGLTPRYEDDDDGACT